MRSKKSKEPKKYVAGGLVLAGALGAGQALLGLGQYVAGQSAASRIKEASTARPSEYAEMLKLARGNELETKRLEELNRSIATGISAAQGAGGRAVIGALPGMIRASDTGALQILGERQDRTMQALGISAQGSEREIGREINREMMERNAAQAAIEGGLQNIAGGVGQIGAAGVYAAELASKNPDKTTNPSAEDIAKTETLASLRGTEGERAVLAQGFDNMQEEELFPILPAKQSGFGPLPEMKVPSEDLNDRRRFLLPSEMKEGGMVTDGKFDHKTNPINIVKKGQKIGEMTGGEVILNPAQQQKLSKESAYFRQLLKKFNKQK